MNPNNKINLDTFQKLTEVAINTTTRTVGEVKNPPFSMVDITSVTIADMETFYLMEWQNKSFRTKFYTSVDKNDYIRIIRKCKIANILKQ